MPLLAHLTSLRVQSILAQASARFLSSAAPAAAAAAPPCATCGFPQPAQPCPSFACLTQLSAAPTYFSLLGVCVRSR